MTNDGTTYESLLRGLVEIISESHGMDTVRLEARRTVQGRTTTHETDVWWEFRDASGRERHIWFSCKDWSSPIKGEQLWAYKARLEDVDPQPHGVFVTRSRYQKAAHDVAAANGITILELREPTEKDWKGRLKTLRVNLTAYVSEMRAIQVGITEGTERTLEALNEDVRVIEPGKQALSFRELQGQLAYEDNEWEETDWHQATRLFPDGTQLEAPGLAPLPVKSITADVRVLASRQTVVIDGTALVRYIVRDAATGQASWLGEDLVIRGGELGGALGLL